MIMDKSSPGATTRLPPREAWRTNALHLEGGCCPALTFHVDRQVAGAARW